MITVSGEALIDLIVDPAGHIDPRFGGGPGDAFGGAYLAWWTCNGLGQAGLAEPEAVRGAAQAAVYARR